MSIRFSRPFRFTVQAIALLLAFTFLLIQADDIQSQGRGKAGKAGDEEGEFYGGKWPADVPKPDTVEYYLPFEAGKGYGVMPTPGHTAPQNKYAYDWSMPTGTKVLAAADGWVMKAIESGKGTGGPTGSLILSHANGELTCYLHLKHKGVLPRLGDFVFRGDHVAWSGATGGGPPHLHFSRNDSRLMCLEVTFVEGGPGAKSQNESFDQKYGAQMAAFNGAKLAMDIGKKSGFWGSVLKSAENIEKMAPKDGSHPKFKVVHDEVSGLAQGIEDELNAWLDSIDGMLDAGDANGVFYAELAEGELKGTDFAERGKELAEKAKALDDYKSLKKEIKNVERGYKDLRKAYEADFQGADPRKTLPKYLKWLKKNEDAPNYAAVKARADYLQGQLQ